MNAKQQARTEKESNAFYLVQLDRVEDMTRTKVVRMGFAKS
jgi:hypothetical protein